MRWNWLWKLHVMGAGGHCLKSDNILSHLGFARFKLWSDWWGWGNGGGHKGLSRGQGRGKLHPPAESTKERLWARKPVSYRKVSSSDVPEMSDRWSPSSPLPATPAFNQADRVRRFFFSCSLRFPGLPFFFLPGVFRGCSLYVSTLLVSWVRYLPSSSDPNLTGWFFVLGAGLELGETSEVVLISAVWISAIRLWRKNRRRKSWMDFPLSWRSWCSDTALLL